MENGPLLGDNQAALENHSSTTMAPGAVLPEFGYVVAQQNGKVVSKWPRHANRKRQTDNTFLLTDNKKICDVRKKYFLKECKSKKKIKIIK